MPENAILDKISHRLGLGRIAKTERITGGLMHKMYRIETYGGIYAVKILNPEIMKRSGVFDNYRTAERLEKILLGNGLPVVPSIEFSGKKMQQEDNQYYYVFEWIDGKALKPHEITKNHCNIIGSILAGIHKIELKHELTTPKLLDINWDSYIDIAEKNHAEIAKLLKESREVLCKCQTEGNLAVSKIPAVTGICNGDMDCKNVLWVGNEPKIIDLECLCYGNPYTEMFQLALYWSGYDSCRIDYGLLKAFIRAYKDEFGELHADWETLYNSNCGSLEWLEYNVKRALSIECENEEEQKLGVRQTFGTIRQIIYYHSIKDELLKQLN